MLESSIDNNLLKFFLKKRVHYYGIHVGIRILATRVQQFMQRTMGLLIFMYYQTAQHAKGHSCS